MSTRKTITGNLAYDPELAFGQSGKAWVRLTVISNDGKDENAIKCVTRCKAFNEMAENIAESLTKGTRVIAHGREKTEEWEKDGEKKSMNVLLIDSIGPDLRFTAVKVPRNAPTGGGNSQAAGPAGNDPWSTPPPTDEPPF